LGNLNFEPNQTKPFRCIYRGFNFHIIRFAKPMAHLFIVSCIISSTTKIGIILKEVLYS